MSKSRKGFVSIELIIFTIVAMLLGGLFIIQESKFEQKLTNTRSYAEEMIVKIENEGYITEKIIFEASNFLNGIGIREFNIDGTTNKVDKGSEVFLTIRIDSRNMRGGLLNSDVISKHGIAK